jgi:hypothetical protein
VTRAFPKSLARMHRVPASYVDRGDLPVVDKAGQRRWRVETRIDATIETVCAEVVDPAYCPYRLERATGFEPATKSLGSSYSTN